MVCRYFAHVSQYLHNIAFTQRNKDMFDLIKKLFPPETALKDMMSVMSCLCDLLAHFHADRMKGEGSRDAAIDALIQILQDEKSKS